MSLMQDAASRGPQTNEGRGTFWNGGRDPMGSADGLGLGVVELGAGTSVGSGCAFVRFFRSTAGSEQRFLLRSMAGSEQALSSLISDMSFESAE